MGMEFILQEPKLKVHCKRQKPPNTSLLLVCDYFLAPPSHEKTIFTLFLNIFFKITFKKRGACTPSLSRSGSVHMKECTLFFAKTMCKILIYSFIPILSGTHEGVHPLFRQDHVQDSGLHLYPYLIRHTIRRAPSFSPRRRRHKMPVYGLSESESVPI